LGGGKGGTGEGVISEPAVERGGRGGARNKRTDDGGGGRATAGNTTYNFSLSPS